MPESAKPQTTKKKKKRFARTRGCLAWLVFLGFSFVCLIGIALCGGRLYLTNERLRGLIVQNAARALHQDVALASARLRLRSGLRLNDLTVRDPNAPDKPPLLSLGRLDVQYDLSKLASKVITVRRIELASPHIYLEQKDGRWNFEALLPPPGPAKPKPKPKPAAKPAAGPPIWAKPFRLPIDLRIQEIKLSDFCIRIKQEDRAEIRFDGLNFKLTGEISRARNDIRLALYTSNVAEPLQPTPPIDRRAVNLRVRADAQKKPLRLASGLVVHAYVRQKDFQTAEIHLRFELDHTDAAVGQPLPRFNFVCAADAEVNLPEQRAELKSLRVTIGEKSVLAMRAEATHFLPAVGQPAAPHVDARFTRCAFDLGELFRLAQPAAPALRHVEVAGVLRVPTLFAKAAPITEGLEAGVAVRLENLSVKHPDLKAEADGIQVSFDAPRVEVQLKPGRARVVETKATFAARVASARFDAASVRGVAVSLTASAGPVEQSRAGAAVAAARAKVGFGLQRVSARTPQGRAELGPLDFRLDAGARGVRQTGAALRIGEATVDQSLRIGRVAGQAAKPAATLTLAPLTQRLRVAANSIALDGPNAEVKRVEVKQSFRVEGLRAAAAQPKAAAALAAAAQRLDVTLDGVARRGAESRIGRARVEFASEVSRLSASAAAGKSGDAAASVASIRQTARVTAAGVAARGAAVSAQNVALDEELDVNAIAADAQGAKVRIRAVRQRASAAASGENLRHLSAARLTLDVLDPTAQHPQWGAFRVPLHVALDAGGDLQARRFRVRSLRAELGDWLTLTARADAEELGQKRLAAETALHLDLDRAAKLITPQMVERFGEMKLAGAVDVKATAKGSLARGPKPGAVQADVNVKTRLRGLAYPKARASLAALSLDLDAGARYLMDGSVRDIRAKLGFAADGLAAMDMAEARRIALELDAAMPDLDHARAKVAFQVVQAQYHQDDLAVKPLDVKLSLGANADLKAARYRVQGLRFDAGDFLHADLDAAYAVKERAFEVSLRQRLDAARALRQTPEKFTKRLPPMQTTLAQTLRLDAKGRVPSPKEIEALRPPVEATLALGLDGDLGLPQQGLKVRGLKQSLRVRLEPRRVRVDQSLAAAVVMPKAIGDRTLRPTETLSLEVNDLNALALDFQARLPQQAAGAYAQAKLKDFRFLVVRPAGGKKKAQPPAVQEILDRVSADVKLGFSADDLKRLALAKNVALSGAMKGGVRAQVDPSRDVSAALTFGAKEVNAVVRKPDGSPAAQVKGLNADVRFARRFELAREAGPAPPPPPLSETFLGQVETLLAARGRDAERSVYSALRSYEPQRDSFTIKAARAGPAKLEDLALDLNFEDGVWIDHLSLTVLGGSVSGKLGAGRLAGSYAVAVAFEFTGLNGKSMLPFLDQSVPDEDAEISGNFMLVMRLGTQKQVSIDDISMAANITKVGPRALDRFLLAQDPAESNPQIVAARKYTMLGRPYKVSVRVVNGEMRQKISIKVFNGPVISLPLPESIPLAKIMDMSLFDKPLQALTQVRDILQLLAARKIEFGPKGEMRFTR